MAIVFLIGVILGFILLYNIAKSVSNKADNKRKQRMQKTQKGLLPDWAKTNMQWKCGKKVTAKLYGNIMTISGIGAMDDLQGNINSLDFEATHSWKPWAGYQDNIRKVVIEAGVTHIGRMAFWRCENISSVEISNTVKSIGDGAFVGSFLNFVAIPSSVTSIGADAFGGCPKLNISFSGNLEYIGKYAFSGNVWLREKPEGQIRIDKAKYNNEY